MSPLRPDKAGVRGFTLTEIAIVLAIIGLILGAVWVAARAVIDSNRGNQAAQDISTIAANVRSTFIAQNIFTSATEQVASGNAISEGLIPSDLIAPSGSSFPALDSWNQPVKLYFGTPDNRHFRISFYGTPPDACFRIASQLANLGTSDAPVNLITASGGDTEAIANTTTGVTNSKCAGLTIGLCTNAITTACALNPKSGASSSTEFDFTIH